MKRQKGLLSLWKQIFGLLQRRQKRSFWLVLLILAVSAGLSQILPLAVGYLTDSVLADRANISFQATVPVLLVILVTSVANEVIKVIRRLLVEDASTQAEKEARNRAAVSLMRAPMRYFRQNMTGNIHGRLNRSIEGTTKFIKLVFMDFAPAVATGIAAVFVIFSQLPWQVALLMILVVPVGTLIVVY